MTRLTQSGHFAQGYCLPDLSQTLCLEREKLNAGHWAQEANVELAASGYLYSIALIGTAFASFSVLTMIFRQLLGGRMTKLDSLVSRNFIQLGFMATLGSILPPLLALLEIPPSTNWRASSAVMAVILGWWALTFERRRQATTPTKTAKSVLFFVVVLGIAALALAINAVIAPAERLVGIYAASVTVIVICGGNLFLLSLTYLFDRPLDPKAPRPFDPKAPKAKSRG
jgi:hypothetical protein